MKATKEYIEDKFKEYNALCFGGALLPLPIRLSSARTYLGKISFKRDRLADGKWNNHTFTFHISTLVDLPEREVEDTILHEMIHYYILSNQIEDTSPHGVVFKRMMNAINRNFNRHITITHKKTKEELDNDTEVRRHLIGVSRFKTGEVGITIAAKTRLFRLWDELPKIPNVVECRWYLSTNPYFNRFPRAISVKVYSIASAVLDEQLKDAKPLVKDGNTIRVGR